MGEDSQAEDDACSIDVCGGDPVAGVVELNAMEWASHDYEWPVVDDPTMHLEGELYLRLLRWQNERLTAMRRTVPRRATRQADGKRAVRVRDGGGRTGGEGIDRKAQE